MAQLAVEWAKGVNFDWIMDQSRLGTTAMSTGAQGPPGQATQGGSGGGFRASDLGSFHPDLEDSYGTGDIIFPSKETIYREVCSFGRRVEDCAILKGKATARADLSTCVRGTALYWWLDTLSQDEKYTIKEIFFRGSTSPLPYVQFIGVHRMASPLLAAGGGNVRTNDAGMDLGKHMVRYPFQRDIAKSSRIY